MKSYVVIARFDEETERKIVDLQSKLTGCSIPDWPPHVTIAAYENFEEKLLCERTSDFVSKHEKMKIALTSLSILPPGGEHTETAVLCLDPAHSKPFVDFYYSFHEKHEEYCTGVGQFNSIVNDSPVIHATIGIVKVKELQKAMETTLSSGVFGQAEITALEVYELPKRFVKRYELIG